MTGGRRHDHEDGTLIGALCAQGARLTGTDGGGVSVQFTPGVGPSIDALRGLDADELAAGPSTGTALGSARIRASRTGTGR